MRPHRVLVAYASEGGGTAGVAHTIGRALSTFDVDVDVSGVRFARRLDRYDAVLVGSPHRRGDWHPDAAAFLKRHRRHLSSPLVWLFHISSALTDDPSRLPADVLRHARRIGVVGVLDLMAPSAGTGVSDATVADEIANADAIAPLARLVVESLDRRRVLSPRAG